MTDETEKIRVAFYLRVSSDDQRERQTIRTQRDILERWRDQHEVTHEVMGWFADDGVSGTTPLQGRPEGARLVGLAQARGIDLIVVTRMDRLGRTSLDLIQAREHFDSVSVSVMAVLENVEDPFEYELRAVLAAEERRRFLKRSKEGMERAAREGRYCGGIVPLGYKVEGTKFQARLVPSDGLIYGDWTEADLVRQMYAWLAVEGWSCVRIADYLNGLGVPTSYAKDGRLVKKRGERAERTQGRWRAGRIRNLIVNPIYKGEYQYGRRTKYQRAVLTSSVPALVSNEMWEEAQRQLRANRLMTKNPGRTYLLRSLARCSICGLTFVGTPGRAGLAWYRCNGQIVGRGPIEGRCPSRAFRADWIEPVVLEDVKSWLSDPGAIVEQLREERHQTTAQGVQEAERLMIQAALADLPRQRDSLLEALRHQIVTMDDLKGQFEAIANEEATLRKRLAELEPQDDADELPLSEDLVAEIRHRVDGLDREQWREVLSILVKRVDVKTEVIGPRSKRLTLTIHYRFGGVVLDDPGTGSLPRRA
jgi:site-specific DNA recombinase